MNAIKPWIKYTIAGLFFFYQFLQMTMFNSLAEPLMADFNMTPSEVGLLGAVFFVTATFLSIPAGWMIDKFPIRRVILVGMALSIINVWLMQESQTIMSLTMARISQGALQACCFISVLKLATYYFPARHMALASGLLVTLGMLGGIFAQEQFALLIQAFGWREALWYTAGAGCVILLLQLLAIDDIKVTTNSSTTANTSYLWAAIKNRQNWLTGLYISMINLPLMVLGGLWGNQYLMITRYVDEITAASICSMLFVGTLFGSPLMGYLSDKMGRRCILMNLAIIGTLGLFALVVFLPLLSSLQLHLLFLLIGIITSAQIIGYPLITESNPQIYVGSALAVASTIIMGGPLVFQPAFGWLVEEYNFGMAILLLPSALIISFLCVVLLKETYCKSAERTVAN